jgi:hypothetical protein
MSFLQSGHGNRTDFNDEDEEDYLNSSAAMKNPANLRFKDLK